MGIVGSEKHLPTAAATPSFCAMSKMIAKLDFEPNRYCWQNTNETMIINEKMENLLVIILFTCNTSTYIADENIRVYEYNDIQNMGRLKLKDGAHR